MHRSRHSALARVARGSLLLPAAFALALNASPAAASCSDRPETPGNVALTDVTATSIVLGWVNKNAGGGGLNPFGAYDRWFDIYLRKQPVTNNIGRDLTGTGPIKVANGQHSTRAFTGLDPDTTYCFSMRARTGGGTQGCISRINSPWVCATTASLPGVTTPPSHAPIGALGKRPAPEAVKTLGKVNQVATAKNDVDIYNGPGGQFNVVGMLRSGGQGLVKSRQEGWYQLKFDAPGGTLQVPGGTGWIAADHLAIALSRSSNIRN